MDQAGADRAQAAAAIRSAGIGNQAGAGDEPGRHPERVQLGNVGLNSFGLQRGALDKLAAQQTQLALDKGDFKTTQRQSILSNEADQALKNALTSAQIGSQTANTAATTASTAKTKVTTTKTKAELDYFKQHGYYPKTGPTAKKAPDTITSGAFAGYTKTQVAKMAPDRKQQILDAYNKKPSKSAKADQPKSGPGSLTSAAESKVVSQINKVYQALANPTVTTKDPNGNAQVKPASAAQVLKNLRAQNIDPRVLNVARSLLHNGGQGRGRDGPEERTRSRHPCVAALEGCAEGGG
jgi:hypothetical protein